MHLNLFWDGIKLWEAVASTHIGSRKHVTLLMPINYPALRRCSSHQNSTCVFGFTIELFVKKLKCISLINRVDKERAVSEAMQTFDSVHLNLVHEYNAFSNLMRDYNKPLKWTFSVNCTPAAISMLVGSRHPSVLGCYFVLLLICKVKCMWKFAACVFFFLGSKASSWVPFVALLGRMFTAWHQSDSCRGASKVTYWLREERQRSRSASVGRVWKGKIPTSIS